MTHTENIQALRKEDLVADQQRMFVRQMLDGTFKKKPLKHY